MVMQDAKRRMGGDDKSPFTLSFRFSNDLVKKINLRWKEDGFANRTALVEAACNLYFDSLECPRCKNRNHKNSLFCSICGNSLNPSYELKKDLKAIYDNFMEYQEKILSFERGFDEEKAEYNKKISSINLNPELKSSLADILDSAAEDYWLGLALQMLETDTTEEVCQNIPSGYHDYIFKFSVVRAFFHSSIYLKDTPHLTVDKAREIEDFIGDLVDFQIRYELGLKRDLNLYTQVNKLIDKLTEN